MLFGGKLFPACLLGKSENMSASAVLGCSNIKQKRNIRARGTKVWLNAINRREHNLPHRVNKKKFYRTNFITLTSCEKRLNIEAIPTISHKNPKLQHPSSEGCEKESLLTPSSLIVMAWSGGGSGMVREK